MADYMLELWQSTDGLYSRFDLQPTREAVTRKLLEEVAEAVTAMFENSDLKLSEEIADVMVCLMGLAQREGLTLYAIQSAMYGVACKNNSKTDDTHEVRGGTICRRVKV